MFVVLRCVGCVVMCLPGKNGLIFQFRRMKAEGRGGWALLCLVFLSISCSSSYGFESFPRLNCSQFDPAKIKLITFDVFGALMDTPTSLLHNVATLLPELETSEVIFLGEPLLSK